MTTSQKRVLFITTIGLSFESGGTRYSKSVLNAFSKQCEVETVVLAECQIIQNKKFRWIVAIVKSLLTGIPPNVLFHSGLLCSKTRKLISEPFHFVVVDHMESGHAVSGVPETLFVYVSHNRESELIKQKLPTVPKWLRKILIAWVDVYEKRLAISSSGIVSISNIEAIWYQQFSKNVEVVYPVFEIPAKRAIKENPHNFLRLGFLGSATWRPNAEAMNLLIDEILPHVSRKVELVVAGNGWTKFDVSGRIKQSENLNNVSVKVLDYVSDIQEFWFAIDVFVAPIVSGAGINVKVCEAIVNRVRVISLPLAVRGLSANCVTDVTVVENASDFADSVNKFKLCEVDNQYPKEFLMSFAVSRVSKIVNRLQS